MEDDGTVTGARPRHEAGRTDLLRVQALIANMTQPPLSVIVGTARVEDREVLVVEVPDSPRVVGTTRGTYVRRATTGELARLVQRTEAETRNLLTRMVERGWIEARGGGKGRTWHLSAAVYRALDTPAGYVRTSGLRPDARL